MKGTGGQAFRPKGSGHHDYGRRERGLAARELTKYVTVFEEVMSHELAHYFSGLTQPL